MTYSDPHVPKLPKMKHHDLPEMESAELSSDFLSQLDKLIIAIDHSEFDYQPIVDECALVIDTRNATKAVNRRSRTVRKT